LSDLLQNGWSEQPNPATGWRWVGIGQGAQAAAWSLRWVWPDKVALHAEDDVRRSELAARHDEIAEEHNRTLPAARRRLDGNYACSPQHFPKFPFWEVGHQIPTLYLPHAVSTFCRQPAIPAITRRRPSTCRH
jgi:hypothetical protein